MLRNSREAYLLDRMAVRDLLDSFTEISVREFLRAGPFHHVLLGEEDPTRGLIKAIALELKHLASMCTRGDCLAPRDRLFLRVAWELEMVAVSDAGVLHRTATAAGQPILTVQAFKTEAVESRVRLRDEDAVGEGRSIDESSVARCVEGMRMQRGMSGEVG